MVETRACERKRSNEREGGLRLIARERWINKREQQRREQKKEQINPERKRVNTEYAG